MVVMCRDSCWATLRHPRCWRGFHQHELTTPKQKTTLSSMILWKSIILHHVSGQLCSWTPYNRKGAQVGERGALFEGHLRAKDAFGEQPRSIRRVVKVAVAEIFQRRKRIIFIIVLIGIEVCVYGQFLEDIR